jgi:hypothetical protein
MFSAQEAHALFAKNHTPFQVLPVLHFAPKARVGLQLLLTLLACAVAYAVYSHTRLVFDATGSTGLVLPAKAAIPGWAYVLGPALGCIAGAYIVVFLRYNFLQ